MKHRAAWLLAVLSLLGAAFAHAHMPSGYDLRAIHFAHSDRGLDAYFRLTLPLAVANGLGPKDGTGFHAAAPYTVRRIESAHAFYYADDARIQRDPGGLGMLVLQGHALETGGAVVTPALQSVRVYPKGFVPPFGTLEQARAAAGPGEPYPGNAAEVDAAYAIVDVHAFYAKPGGIGRFAFSSGLTNRVIGQSSVQTLLVDHTPSGPVMYRRSGALDDPIEVNPAWVRSLASFVAEGARHIAGGMDHLLFVLCLTLGAMTLPVLMWRVSGFTLGHAATIGAAFLGYVPSQPWFGPAVEAAIAASILLASASVVSRRGDRKLFWLSAVIGLVHGFGFSAALGEMLQRDGPNPWWSLLGFNLGIETAQIAFAALVWWAARALAHSSSRWQRRVSVSVAVACAGISVVWIVQRTQALIALQA